MTIYVVVERPRSHDSGDATPVVAFTDKATAVAGAAARDAVDRAISDERRRTDPISNDVGLHNYWVVDIELRGDLPAPPLGVADTRP